MSIPETDDLEDGGPAFPVTPAEGPNFMGMTLRDWFAGQALAGRLAALNPGGLDRAASEYMAEQSYRLADAMLEEREK